LQQIADAIQYSKAGLLRYFPSKEAIYRAAIAAAHDQALYQ
jgi:AcrR family transcriptional regulator